MNLSRDINFPEGYVLPVNKPLGWTSSDVVRKMRIILRHLGYRKIKVGHAGTLDPLATGVLLICIGRATKQAEALQAEKKEYLATVAFGATTPSYDMEHPVNETFPYQHITREAVEKALAEMIGEQLQVPPLYSAKQIDGVRAYEHARKGNDIELPRTLVNIYDMRLESMGQTGAETVSRVKTGALKYEGAEPEVISVDELPTATIRISCSKGTYIRSIARDLGKKLGSGGFLTSLVRTQSGNFSLEDCYFLEDVEKILLPVKQI